MKTCILFILFLPSLLISQNKEKIATLKNLGRDSLIKLAIKKVNDPAFDPAAYDRIIVKADTGKLIVEFGLSVRLKKGCYYDVIWISLAGSGGGRSITGECEEPRYYKLSAKDKKKIDFVFESINKKNEVGDIPGGKLDNDETMEITEKATYYYVEFSSWSTFSHYKIKKVSGEIFDAGHKHYARDPDEKEKFEIVK